MVTGAKWPAFPCNSPDGVDSFSGITVREYFAAKAMQSLIISTQDISFVTPEILVAEACNYADALLKELDKQ